MEQQKNKENAPVLDIHNMRIINYAGFYQMDCHLTAPYYYPIQQGHAVLDQMRKILSQHFKDKVDFFVHSDAGRFYQCPLCKIDDCLVRQKQFVQTITWSVENLISNEKHKT